MLKNTKQPDLLIPRGPNGIHLCTDVTEEELHTFAKLINL